MPDPEQNVRTRPAIQRVPGALAKAALIGLGAIILVELCLQLASFFAPSRAGAWREGAEHRILCVGDSHTWGAGVAREEAYPSQLREFLEARDPKSHSVINLGLPGMNTSQVRNRLPVWISRYEPTLVVVWAGVNNSWNIAEVERGGGSATRWLETVALRSRFYRFVRVWLHDRQLKRYRVMSEADHEYRIKTTPASQKGRGDQPYVVQHDGVVEVIRHREIQKGSADGGDERSREAAQRVVRDFSAIREITRAAGAGLVFITYPLEVGPFGTANSAIRRAAELEGVPVVDSNQAMSRIPREEWVWMWAAHPSGPMYTEVARDLVSVVLDLEREQSGAP